MNASRPTVAIIGGGLVVLGALALGARSLGLDRTLDAGTIWPIFVVVPGLVLFAAAFAVTPPKGLGFAIAGSIIATTGIVLAVQAATDRYDTWAYAWTLVGPGAAGVGLLAYGLLTGSSQLLRPGLTLAGIAALLFVAGAWYFEPVLTEGRQPIDLQGLWPVLLIMVGAVILGSGLTRPRPGTRV